MTTIGKVEKRLLEKIEAEGTIHFTLLDPENFTPKTATEVAREAERRGTSAIMVGGSTITPPERLNATIKAVKTRVKIPVILFPGNVTGIAPHADAILFMSLLNSNDPYFITGAQALGAPLVKRYGLEPIPMGYIVMGRGGAVGVVGRAQPLPYDKPELAAIYALAAQYMGMHLVYLEGGSGAEDPIPPKLISIVKKTVDIPLIIGGGIRTAAQAREVARAGASIIVTGTAAEGGEGVGELIGEIVAGLRKPRNI